MDFAPKSVINVHNSFRNNTAAPMRASLSAGVKIEDVVLTIYFFTFYGFYYFFHFVTGMHSFEFFFKCQLLHRCFQFILVSDVIPHFLTYHGNIAAVQLMYCFFSVFFFYLHRPICNPPPSFCAQCFQRPLHPHKLPARY